MSNRKAGLIALKGANLMAGVGLRTRTATFDILSIVPLPDWANPTYRRVSVCDDVECS